MSARRVRVAGVGEAVARRAMVLARAAIVSFILADGKIVVYVELDSLYS
jgi:hypothetical protein